MNKKPNDGSLPPTGSDHSGDSSGHDASSLKGLTMALGMEPVEPGRDPLLGCDIGGVKVVRLIAEGGMGRVYEGQQEKPRRTVAVKVMRPGLTSPSLLKRFEYETEVLGRLQHPGIAQIYAVGVHPIGSTTVPYFIMEYIAEARSLTAYAEELKLPTRQRLDLFRGVCDAVAHGHQRGVIHRDLKPGNILVGAGGLPKVIDFGVARATDSDMALTTMQTDVGQLIGTLQYMSPEQCDANPNDIDIRSDVYALGVILYELLAGKLPYDVKKKAVLEAMRIVKEDQPPPISSLNKTLRRDAAVIAGKCLNKDRGRRYSSASELSSDISRYLAGEPILAAPPSLWDGVARLARRHRAAAAAVVATIVSLAVALVAISLFAIRAERARLDAHNSREVAVAARKQAESLVDFLTFDLRHRLSSLGRLDLMKPIAEAVRQYHAARVGRLSDTTDPASAEDLRRRAASHVALGDIARDTGNSETATQHYAEASRLLQQRLATAQSGSPETVELAETHAKLAASLRWAGNSAASRSHYETALHLLSPKATLETDSVTASRILSSVYQGLDELAASEGQAPGDSRDANHAELSYDISARLAASHPKNRLLQRDLAVAGMKLGERLAAKGDRTAAINHFSDALAVCGRLASEEPENAAVEHSLWACYDLLGTAQRKDGDLVSARTYLEKAKALSEDRVRRDSANANHQRELAISLVSLGDVLARLDGEAVRADAHYSRALEILQRLAQKDPLNRVYQENMALAAWRVGVVAMDSSQWERARECFKITLNTNTTNAFPFLEKARALAAECKRKAADQGKAQHP